MVEKGFTPPPLAVISTMIEEQVYKLNESINELIQTEKTYLDRLHTIVDVFQVKLRECMDDTTDSLIFGSIGGLIKCNDAFFKELNKDYVKSLLNHVHFLLIHYLMIDIVGRI